MLRIEDAVAIVCLLFGIAWFGWLRQQNQGHPPSPPARVRDPYYTYYLNACDCDSYTYNYYHELICGQPITVQWQYTYYDNTADDNDTDNDSDVACKINQIP